jgi:hypothetical protein
MLKITYTDTGLLLEYVAQSVETVITQRTVVALRSGQSIYVQPIRASLTLPANLPGMDSLLCLIHRVDSIEIAICDSEGMGLSASHWLEINLAGIWIADSVISEEGIFVAELDPPVEYRLLTLWQQAQVWQPSGASRPAPKGR